MSETTATETVEGGEQQEQGKTFTQEEVNRIITARLKEQAEKKFGDYQDLKSKAEDAKSVEQKLAELEQKHAEAEARALRADIASRYGISPEDRDLFLTGSDADALEAQAKRLAERVADQKKNGNRAPKEGASVDTNLSPKDAAKREWLRSVTERG